MEGAPAGTGRGARRARLRCRRRRGEPPQPRRRRAVTSSMNERRAAPCHSRSFALYGAGGAGRWRPHSTEDAAPARAAAKTRRAETESPAQARVAERHVPVAVSRAVWTQDGSGCAYVEDLNRRSAERRGLELHHGKAHARAAARGKDSLDHRRMIGPFSVSSGSALAGEDLGGCPRRGPAVQHHQDRSNNAWLGAQWSASLRADQLCPIIARTSISLDGFSRARPRQTSPTR